MPTLPLFVHERLSTQGDPRDARSATRRDRQADCFDLFGDPQHSITDQVLSAYEHRDQWVNRMILGDSLVVMNSLLQYEGLGGQVQMIYIDPPYGVKFGSNFQPFVRKRDVKHNDDEDLTREPEMVQGVSRHVGAGAALVSDLPARPAAARARAADAERQRLRADQRREPASCAGADG